MAKTLKTVIRDALADYILGVSLDKATNKVARNVQAHLRRTKR